MEDAGKGKAPDPVVEDAGYNGRGGFVGYIKRQLQERKTKKEKESPADRAARVTTKATVWIAAFTVVMALVGAGTLYEIIEGGSDTHDLAVAAGKQAIATQTIADATYAQIRPWLKIDDIKLRKGIGPARTLMFHWPVPPHQEINPQIQVSASVLNVGHSVAQNAKVFPELFFAVFESTKWHDAVLQEEKRWCD